VPDQWKCNDTQKSILKNNRVQNCKQIITKTLKSNKMTNRKSAKTKSGKNKIIVSKQNEMLSVILKQLSI